jgi:hypothetical protein
MFGVSNQTEDGMKQMTTAAAALALLLATPLNVNADALSEGKCEKDYAASMRLALAIDCTEGFVLDSNVSCADPEASQTDCDDDSDLSRQLREGFNQPFFHTRKEAIAWCARIAVTEPAIYNITTTDLRDYPISVPEVYHCPDGKPHAVVTWSPVIVPPGTYHEVRMRYPEHTFFRPGNWLWSPREVPAEEAAKTIEAWRDMAKYRGAAP